MSKEIQIRLASERVSFPSTPSRAPKIYTPGELITEQKEFMRGHGTYEEDGYLKSSVAGTKEVLNKLVSIHPLKVMYHGKIGDVVIGRITEVGQKRWKVETNSKLDSVLLLSSVNLPGGELRRKSEEDEHKMREYLQEGDLISAEVQNVFQDGSLSLHARSLKYGKLSQGVLIQVFPVLIKKSKTRFYNLPVGVSIILGSNGYIWIAPVASSDEENVGGFTQNLDKVVPRSERETIARIRNCVAALAHCRIMLYDTSILYAYEESLKYNLAELLTSEAMVDVGLMTQERIATSFAQ